MNTLLQLGWGVWMILWWISGLIIFLFVVLLIFRAVWGVKDTKGYHKKLRKLYETRRFDKSKFEQLTETLEEEEELYQN